LDQNDPVIDPLSGLLEIIIAKKFIIIIGFSIVISLTVISSILLPDVYEAYTTIYVISPTLPKIEVPYMEEYASRAFLINQKQLIKSRVILEKVIKKLENYPEKEPDDYFEKQKKKFIKFFNIPVKKLETIDPLEKAIEKLDKQIRVKLPRGSNIVKISATSKKSEVAAFIANTLANVYIEYSNSLFSSKAQNAFKFIQKQAESARRNYIDSENRLNLLKTQMLQLPISEEYLTLAQKLNNLEEEKSDIQSKIDDLLIEKKKLNLNPSYTPIETTTIDERQSNPEIDIYNAELEKLNNELLDKLSIYTAAHPDVIRLKGKIFEVEKKIAFLKNNAENNFSNGFITVASQNKSYSNKKNTVDLVEFKLERFRTKQRVVSEEIEKLLETRNEIYKNQVLVEKLNRELENNYRTLALLRTKRDEAKILNATEKKGNIRVIDRAVPPLHPVMRKKIILLSVGTILALIFGTGMAFIAEFFDDSIKTPDGADDYLEVPVLGIIPKISTKARKKL
jgi:uncharacterized protein involved in exopolysaccharide biosynthesis